MSLSADADQLVTRKTEHADKETYFIHLKIKTSFSDKWPLTFDVLAFKRHRLVPDRSLPAAVTGRGPVKQPDLSRQDLLVKLETTEAAGVRPGSLNQSMLLLFPLNAGFFPGDSLSGFSKVTD